MLKIMRHIQYCRMARKNNNLLGIFWDGSNGTHEVDAVLPLRRWREPHHIHAASKSPTSVCFSQCNQHRSLPSTATPLIATTGVICLAVGKAQLRSNRWGPPSLSCPSECGCSGRVLSLSNGSTGGRTLGNFFWLFPSFHQRFRII